MSALYGLRHERDDDDDDADGGWVSQVTAAAPGVSPVFNRLFSDEDEEEDDGAWAAGVTAAASVVAAAIVAGWAGEADDPDDDDSEALTQFIAPLNDYVTITASEAEDDDEEEGSWSAWIVDVVALVVPDIFSFQQEGDDPDDDDPEQIAQVTPDFNDYIAGVQSEANDPDDDDPEQGLQVVAGLNDYVASWFDADDEAEDDDHAWAAAKVDALFAPDIPTIELLGGGPGKVRRHYDKDSYVARLLAPPIEDAPIEIETGIVDVPAPPLVITLPERRDDSDLVRESYRDAAKTINKQRAAQRQQEDDEAIAIFAALL